jgi:alkanesulfonate monooxygenase SsuD/methylene tetrahydromethanopterin reductase-like flavin-dependent oxidoreductase (luciferase family)
MARRQNALDPARHDGQRAATAPPLLTARMAANVDQLSGGRFVLGIGVGWSRSEYEALGLPFDRRERITDEYLEVLTAFWSHDRVSATGDFVAFDDVSTGPRPAQSPHVPIWVGGSAPAAIRRAARHGQAWHPNNQQLPWLRDTGLPALRDAAASIGRPAPSFCPRMQRRVTSSAVRDPDRPPGTGTLGQIADDLEAYAGLGAECLLLDTNPDDPHDRRARDRGFPEPRGGRRALATLTPATRFSSRAAHSRVSGRSLLQQTSIVLCS